MNKCSKHPKYKGKNKPKFECVECLNVWDKIRQVRRFSVMPTKVVNSKKTYDRKKQKVPQDREF